MKHNPVFYLVKPTKLGVSLWVAVKIDNSDLFVYVPNTKKFHLNNSLTSDFFVQQELYYENISPSAVAKIILEGEIGNLLPINKTSQLNHYIEDPDFISPYSISAELTWALLDT